MLHLTSKLNEKREKDREFSKKKQGEYKSTARRYRRSYIVTVAILKVSKVKRNMEEKKRRRDIDDAAGCSMQVQMHELPCKYVWVRSRCHRRSISLRGTGGN